MTMSQVAARRRMTVTQQRSKSTHLRPTHWSLVAVRSRQSAELSARVRSSARSPVSVFSRQARILSYTPASPGEAPNTEEGLKALAYRNFDVNVVQVLEREELSWTQTGSFILEDVETGELRRTSVDMAQVEQFRKRVQAFMTGIHDFCQSFGMHYYLYDTQVPFEEFLVEYVTKGTAFR